MASALQIQANRLNSQNSTGPRSPEGKAASRFNALKSGIHANSQVIPGEDPAELEALASDYHEQFQPATPLGCFLVDALVHADWQLRRLHRVEAQLWTDQISQTAADNGSPLGEVYNRALDTFTRLQRRIDTTERFYFKVLAQLQRIDHDTVPIDPAPDPCPPPPAELASFCHAPLAPPIAAAEPSSSGQTPRAAPAPNCTTGSQLPQILPQAHC